MERAIQIATLALILALILGVGIGIWGCFGLSAHLISAVDHLSDASAQLATAGQAINNPKWGTLHEVDHVLLDSRMTLDLLNKAALHEDKQLTVLDGHLTEAFSDIHSTAQAAQGTFTALAGTANALTVDEQTANGTIAAAQPFLGQLTATAKDADIVINNPQIGLTLTDIQKSMANTAVITGDAAKVSEHFEEIIDTPKKRTFWGTVKQGWQVIWQCSMLAK